MLQDVFCAVSDVKSNKAITELTVPQHVSNRKPQEGRVEAAGAQTYGNSMGTQANAEHGVSGAKKPPPHLRRLSMKMC